MPFSQLRLPLFAACAALALTGAARGGELFLADSSGQISRGDPTLGGFVPFASCSGPVVSITRDGADLFFADQSGDIYHFDAAQGAVTQVFNAGTDLRTLLMFEGDLLVGGSHGTIRRLDKSSGALIAVYTPGVPIDAMVDVGSAFFIASSQGLILRADLGQNLYLTVANIPGAIHSMAADTTHLYVADPMGQVWRVQPVSGAIVNTFFAPNDASGLEAQGGDLLVAGSDSTVWRIKVANGFPVSSLPTPAPVLASVLSEIPEPGLAYCYGLTCPCGNDDPDGGCLNSTTQGARLRGTGSASVAADDLVMTATRLPPNKPALFIVGPGLAWSFFYDGILCAGTAGVRRYAFGSTGPGGTLTLGPGVVALSQRFSPQLTPGSSWSFQVWYRDKQGPCGSSANISNAYRLTLLP